MASDPPPELTLGTLGQDQRLRFPVAPGVQSRVSVLLRNDSEDQIAAFRVKTSDAARFNFMPSMGTVQPGASTEVIASFMHRGATPPHDIGTCMAFHVVQSRFVEPALAEQLESRLFDFGPPGRHKLLTDLVAVAAPEPAPIEGQIASMTLGGAAPAAAPSAAPGAAPAEEASPEAAGAAPEPDWPAEPTDILPYTPWREIQPTSSCVECLRGSAAVREAVPNIERILRDVQAKVQHRLLQLRLASHPRPSISSAPQIPA